jgi:plastocyanin
MVRARSALVGLTVVVFATGVAACGGDDDSSSSSDPAPATTVHMGSMPAAPGAAGGAAPAATMAPDGEAAPMAVTVEIQDFAFMSQDVRVAAGGTVTWVNQDSQQHTATGEGTFDTGAVPPGESVTVTFDEAGSFPYVCSFHPFMTGTVTVG